MSAAIPSHEQLGRPLLLRLQNAAKALDMPPETLRQLVRRGAIPSVKVGAAVYVRTRDLEIIAENGLHVGSIGPRSIAPRGHRGRFCSQGGTE